MAFAKWSRPIQDEAGNLIPDVYCEVRRAVQGTPLAVLYADREGTVPLGNPFFAADGVPVFFAIGGAYNVRAYATGYDETFDYQAVGTGAEVDANELLQPGYLLEFEIQTTAPPADGAVRANNVDLSAATRLFVSKVNTAGSSIAPRLAAMAPNGKANKNVLAVTSADGLQVSWDVDAVTDHTDYAELTVSNHSGEDSLNAGTINLQLLVSGSDGFVPGVSLIFDATTAAADPGAGKFRLNHATASSATAIYIDNVEALGGASITALLDSWDDAAAAIRGQLLVVSKINPAIFRLYNVTGSVVDSTGYRTVTIAHVSGNGTLTDLTPCVLAFTRSGDDGFAPGYRLTFSTTITDADPGAGAVRFNHATFGSITYVYVDNQDAAAVSLTTWLDGLDDVLNVNARAYLRFQKATDPTVYAEFAVVGPVLDGTGYRKIPVSPVAGAVPANGTVLVATASKSGADAAAAFPDQVRVNMARLGGYQAKTIGTPQRGKDTLWDGFADSNGINAGRSGNYSVDTSGKRIVATVAGGVISTSGKTKIGNLTSGGGLAAAFDGTTSQAYASSANISTSNSGYNNTIGVDWGVGVTKTVVGFKLWSTSDFGLNGGAGAAAVKLQGSNDNSAWTDLFTSPGSVLATGGSTYEVTSGITAGAYRYHRINGNGNGSNGMGLAEVQFSETGLTNNMTYSSALQTADAAVTSVTAFFEIDTIDAITLGTDLTGIATCNGWTNNGSVTLSSMGRGQSGRTVVKAVATGLTSGTSFGVELVYANNKNAPIHFVEVRAE